MSKPIPEETLEKLKTRLYEQTKQMRQQSKYANYYFNEAVKARVRFKLLSNAFWGFIGHALGIGFITGWLFKKFIY